jgi:hypothetical protein
MRFNYEAERMEHPQARLIPQSVWRRYDFNRFFEHELLEFQLTLMQITSRDLDDYLASFEDNTLEFIDTHEKKYIAWLALAYTHPDINDALLLRFADRLGLSNEDSFKLTATLGKLSLLNKIIEANTSQIQNMISAGRYGVFLDAVENGHLGIVNCLIETLTTLAPDDVQTMISINNDKGFILAMSRGFLPIMDRLFELEPEVIDRLTYDWIQKAVIHGHLPIIERIFSICSMLNPAAVIKVENYKLCHDAAYMGHLPLLRYLMEYEQNNAQDMLQTHGESILRAAVRGEEQSRRKNINHAYVCRDTHLIAIANESNSLTHTHVIHHLLSFPKIFAYAEIHEHEHWASYIPSFVDTQLGVLQEQRSVIEAHTPQAVFDITDPEEAKLCFYILRNLIRRNDPVLLDDIRFLIEIPSVKALLHTDVTPNQPSELFRLALSLGNQDAAEILLTVPAVYELARENDFYRLEARGGLDLEALAHDHESSMTALTSGEQKRLEAAFKLYQPVIDERGAPALIQTLREQLKSRYEAEPARVRTGDGRELDLPFDWNDWQVLSTTLSADTREQALEAYYQHQDHTAFRYLSKPNLWMAENAPYVNRSNLGGWSTFAEYQPLIAMFYLGARDENTPPCDGHTFETRLEHFIDELAHICRAHNWDSSRTNAQGVLEEYDDLRGDKPSCYSGVKRRLFQSVLGHPLLKILTMDDIKQELREYVREHFKQSVLEHPAEAVEWKKAWDTVCETGMGGEKLAEMNIPEDAQTALIEALREKYPSQFDEDPSFQTYIQDRFKLNEPVTTHAARFGGEVDLTALLELCVAKEAVSREALRALRLNNSIYAQPNSRGEDESSEQAPDEGRQPKV